MSRLIFDIETVGADFESFDATTQEYLLSSAKTPEEQDLVRDRMGFSPLTGEIVAISILNPDTHKGATFFQAPESNLEPYTKDDVQYVPSTEKEILQRFWDAARYYDQFITFNGRAFDAPFVIVRSAVHSVHPTRDLMPNRYSGEGHVDLFDRLSFFGAVRKTMSLHMWCQAFGIASSKADGVTGDDVARLFMEKKYTDIAEYCFRDVVATAELFKIWETYMQPPRR
ncbi:MAG: ribonuclease H-like domain-containing protein [Patescibacteria group bacterium]